MANDGKEKSKFKNGIADGYLDFDVHRISLEELFERYGTNIVRGLTVQKARENLSKYGYNTLTPLSTTSKWINLLLKYLFCGFSILLWFRVMFFLISFFLSFTGPDSRLDNIYLTITSIIVVIIYGGVPYLSELKAFRSARMLHKNVPQTARVIRDGITSEIRAEELTLGDIVELKSGDFVPADIRIIESKNFWIDSSVLTGYVSPQEKCSQLTHVDPLQTNNLVFFSSIVNQGTAKGIVFGTGMDTMKGRILQSTLDIKTSEGIFNKDMSNIFLTMITLGIFLDLVCFVLMFVLGYFWLDCIILITVIFMAVMPQGLLVSMILSLPLATKRLSSVNCVVKNWSILGNLGLTSTLIANKTTALSQNKIRVAHLWLGNRLIEVDESENQQKIPEFKKSVEWKQLENCIFLSSRGEFRMYSTVREDNGVVNSRSIEKALSDLSNQSMMYTKTKLWETPCQDNIKYSISVHKSDETGLMVMVIKGDPEEILDKCSTVMIDGIEIPLAPELKSSILKDMNHLNYLGEEVIGFCELNLTSENYPFGDSFENNEMNFPMEGFRFNGLVSFVDPPRANVPNAISTCLSAGIKVIMITTDSPVASEAFAQNIGLISKEERTACEVYNFKESSCEGLSENKVRIIQGNQFEHMSDQELKDIVFKSSKIVFTKVTPAQKALIVKACQTIGGIIGMVGGGADDAPAIKSSNVGIAMGDSVSDISSRVADLILLDNNFASVVYGIEEGRLFYDNLKKVISYSLSSDVAKLAPFFLFIILDLPMPLSTILILFLDFGTDMLPAVSLMNETPEFPLMHRAPENSNRSRLLNINTLFHAYFRIGLFELGAGLFGYFSVLMEHGFYPSQLMGLRSAWDSPHINDLVDYYGQEWAYSERKSLLIAAQIAFFISVVFLQCINLIASKTKWISIFKQGLKNTYLNLALVLVAVLAVIGVYVSGMGVHLQKFHLSDSFWIQNCIMGTFLILQEELHKLFFRLIS